MVRGGAGGGGCSALIALRVLSSLPHSHHPFFIPSSSLSSPTIEQKRGGVDGRYYNRHILHRHVLSPPLRPLVPGSWTPPLPPSAGRGSFELVDDRHCSLCILALPPTKFPFFFFTLQRNISGTVTNVCTQLKEPPKGCICAFVLSVTFVTKTPVHAAISQSFKVFFCSFPPLQLYFPSFQFSFTPVPVVQSVPIRSVPSHSRISFPLVSQMNLSPPLSYFDNFVFLSFRPVLDQFQ